MAELGSSVANLMVGQRVMAGLHFGGYAEQVRVRADSGFAYQPVLERLEVHRTQYAVAARFTKELKQVIVSLSYEPANPVWALAQGEYRLRDWPHARHVVDIPLGPAPTPD